MKLITCIAVGDIKYGQMCLNLAISIKVNNPEQKIGIVYDDAAIMGIEELLFKYIDFGYRITDAEYKDYELANYLKVNLYDYIPKLSEGVTEVIYLDSDVLIMPGNSVAEFFDKNAQYDYFFYKNGEYDYEKQKRSRGDGSFWCHPEKAKKELEPDAAIKHSMPQVVSSFLYFKMNYDALAMFQSADVIWHSSVSFQKRKGFKCADFCFNIACAVLGSPAPKYYRPIFLQQYSEKRNDIYIWHRYRAIGLDSKIYYDTRIISLYNNVCNYYRELEGIKESFFVKISKTESVNKKVYGFWHIYMVNHYMEIVGEQLNLIKSSGLYDKAETIYVGCVGEKEKLEVLKALFKEYPKIKITTHKTDASQYEYPTVKLIEQKAKEINESPFYGFYIHTKGVTYPNPPYRHGGDMFRTFLNHYVIYKWKDCLEGLQKGSDVAGAGWIKEGDYPAHYRGNFWWADSEYIKKLPELETLDKDNRFNAEFWIGMGSPNPCVLSSTVVDYDTAPILVPMEIKNADKRTVDMVRPFGIDEQPHKDMWAKKDVTVLICQRKTKDLIQLCLESLLRFYPDIPVLIVDGESDDDSLLYIKLKAAMNSNVSLWENKGNVRGKHTSHGETMDLALKGHITTKYALIMDSDVIIQRGGWVEEMISQFENKNLYATGTLMLVSKKGEGCKPPESDDDILRYAHPSCSMINREMYVGMKPFADHGAPSIWNMIDAAEKGYDVAYYPVDKYVAHLSGSSWTDPRTIWRHDFDVMIRPFVSFLVNSNKREVMPDKQLDHDYEIWDLCVEGEPISVVIHGSNPVVTSGNKYHIRFNVTGEYVCEAPKSYTNIPETFVGTAKQKCIELNAPDEFEVDGIKLVKRKVWQEKYSIQ